MRIRSIFICLIVFCIALFVLSNGITQLASSRVLDPGMMSPERIFLSKIASELDTQGIDTVYGKSSDYPLTPGAVRVAPLAGFAPIKYDLGKFLKDSWMDAFKKGVIGFLAVVPNSPSALSDADAKCIQSIATLGQDVCEFVRKWLSAPSDQRIFLAFTKDDFEHARRVKSSLEKAGFTVFLFLKGKDDKPWADPAMVGEVFAQARFRMVIDSVNARGSAGVALEHECCEPLLLPPPPTTSLSLALQGKS